MGTIYRRRLAEGSADHCGGKWHGETELCPM